MNSKDVAVEQLYESYKTNGFITDDEIYNVCDEYNLSIFDTDYVANKIYDLGVLVSEQPNIAANINKSEDTQDNELTDYAQIDYNIIYDYFLSNYPQVKYIIDYSKSIAPIQHGEMNQLIAQIRSGNSHARNIAFSKYIRLALKSAYNYREKTMLPLEDIFQVACLSVLKAIDSYDPYQNSAFTSYCSTWIMQGIERYIADHESFIRIPVHAQEQIHSLDKIVNNYRNYKNSELLSIIMDELLLPYNEACSLLEIYNETKNIYLEDIFESYDT